MEMMEMLHEDGLNFLFLILTFAPFEIFPVDIIHSN